MLLPPCCCCCLLSSAYLWYAQTKAAKKRAELAKNSGDFRDASGKAAKARVLKGGWPVYGTFSVEDSGRDVRVYAPKQRPEISKKGVVSSAWMAEDLNRVRIYAPL